MCWNLEASATVAAIGLASTAYAAYKREPVVLTASLAYFSSMELLQAFTYTVVDACGTPLNEMYTLLGYLHITFQPFFINAVSLYFVAREVHKRIAPYVYASCFGASIFMLLNLYPFAGAGQCVDQAPMCGTGLCSYYGSVHIAWDFPMNGLMNWTYDFPLPTGGIWMPYLLVGFVLPLVYGSWRFTAYHFLMGPFLAYQITGSLDEMGAFWCLLSIMFLLIVIKTPIRRLLFVDRWIWWRRPLGEPHEQDRFQPVPAE